ncbi:MAG: four helix bundle protein [Melioribacteraceae bacterium]
MKVLKFEDMKVWQDARLFVQKIYKITENAQFKKNYSFREQIQKASISIMNNIAEGYERDSNKELIKFLSYSKGSSGELRNMLYIALDLKYISQEEFQELLEMNLSISKQLSNFIKYLKNRNK